MTRTTRPIPRAGRRGAGGAAGVPARPGRRGSGHTAAVRRRVTPRRQLAFASRIRGELLDQGHSLASALRILGLQDDLAAGRALTARFRCQLHRGQGYGHGPPAEGRGKKVRPAAQPPRDRRRSPPRWAEEMIMPARAQARWGCTSSLAPGRDATASGELGGSIPGTGPVWPIGTDGVPHAGAVITGARGRPRARPPACHQGRRLAGSRRLGRVRLRCPAVP